MIFTKINLAYGLGQAYLDVFDNMRIILKKQKADSDDICAQLQIETNPKLNLTAELKNKKEETLHTDDKPYCALEINIWSNPKTPGQSKSKIKEAILLLELTEEVLGDQVIIFAEGQYPNSQFIEAVLSAEGQNANAWVLNID